MTNIIKTRDGDKSVRSMYNTGDFFVHKRYKGHGYTITHRETGMAVCFCHDHMKFRQAKELAYAYQMVSEYIPVTDKSGKGNKDYGKAMLRVRQLGVVSGYLKEATKEIMRYKDRQFIERQLKEHGHCAQ